MPHLTAHSPHSSAAALQLNRKFLALAAAILCALALSALPASAHADNTGLVGYWSFDDGTGTQATDFSGRGNTGTLVNGPSWTSGKHGGALQFNGSSSYVEYLRHRPKQRRIVWHSHSPLMGLQAVLIRAQQ